MQFQKQLKELIEKRDVTVAQLARATGLSAKTIHHWLSGHVSSDIRKLKKVAAYFDVTLDFICFGEQSKISTNVKDYEDEINAGIFEIILRKARK